VQSVFLLTGPSRLCKLETVLPSRVRAGLIDPLCGCLPGRLVAVAASYEGNSVSKLQNQAANYVFELSAGNCHR
jgi:hypothetical protein